MTSSWIPPWDDKYPPEGNPVMGGHLPWDSPSTDPKTDPRLPLPVHPDVVAAGGALGAPSVKTSASWEQALEEFVIDSAQNMAKEAMPHVQEVLKDLVVAEMTKLIPQPPEPPTLGLDVLDKAEARGAAVRSLLVGMLLTALTGVVTGISAIPAGVNWFTKDGLVAAVAVLGGSVLHSLFTYVSHISFGSPPARSATLARLSPEEHRVLIEGPG